MTLVELLDLAYTSEYIYLNNCDDIKRFAKIWKNFLTTNLDNIQLTEKIQYGINPITGERTRLYNTTYKDLLKDEYKYLIN